jgi:hypothetical protein
MKKKNNHQSLDFHFNEILIDFRNRVAPPHPPETLNFNSNSYNRPNIKRERISIDHRTQVNKLFYIEIFIFLIELNLRKELF